VRTRREALAARQTAMQTVDFEAGLNPEQVEVVRHGEGPCRVLALAGSGKTESLSRRIARMVAGGQDPARILAVTFTKKGGDEMSARIAKKFGVRGARVGTWHSLCLQILREDNLAPSTWRIQDDGPGTSPKMVLKDVLGYKGMDWAGADLAAVERYISHCKANLYAPDSEGAAELARAKLGGLWQRGVEAFSRYNDALRDRALLTFDDYLVFAAEHLLDNEDARRSWAARYDHVLQDEAQDANRAQKTLAELFARDHRNYMIIGDCYQAIYGFRGSTPEFLAEFGKDWPDARTIVLPRNYRSGRAILDAANKVVAKAEMKGIDVPTQLIGERPEEGEVRVLSAESLDDEAASVTATIKGSVDACDSKHADHCILFRTNAQSRAMEDALLASKVPYVVVGGVSFYERKEVRDLLAYLRLAARRAQKDDVKRSINTPFRFLGAAFVDRLMGHVGDADGVDWVGAVLEVARQARIQKRQEASACEWARMVLGLQTKIDAGMLDDATDVQRAAARPAVLLEEVVRATRYIEWINREEGGETTENSGAANVREMVRVAERFGSAAELLDYIDETILAARKQRDDKQAGGDRVLLMSVHRSKGLEWKYVYVAGMNEMVLPHVKGDPQEERRLAYVAMTRARDVLTLSYVRRIATRAGIRDVEPSVFLLDTGLPLDLPTMGAAE
jgi:DNA helicase-2/ATP-dependent DNA helicase PcrA